MRKLEQFMRDTSASSRQFWSSHPAQTRSRVRLFAWLAALPVFLYLGGSLFAFLDNPLEFLKGASLPIWYHGFILLIAVCAAPIITCLLCAKWGELQAFRKIDAMAALDRISFRGFFLGLGFVLLSSLLGLVIALEVDSLPVGVRFGLLLQPVIPILFVLGVLWKFGARAPEGLAYRRRPIWFLLCYIVISLILATVLFDLSVYLEYTRLNQLMAKALPWYRDLGRPFVGFLVLVPLTVVFFSIGQIFVQLVPQEAVSEVVSEGNEPKKGVWERIKEYFGGLFGLNLHPPVAIRETDSSQVPRWLAEAVDQLPGDVGVLKAPWRYTAPGCSGPTAYPGIEMLFNGHSPSPSQVKLLEMFQQRYGDSIPLRHGSESLHDITAAGVLMHGPAGSGRTTGLIACIAQSILIRGQRALVIVPTPDRADIVSSLLNRSFSRLRMDRFLSSARLDKRSVASWLSGEHQPPYSLVCTLGEAEAYLYGTPSHDSPERSGLCELLQRYQVLAVDDLFEFPPTERAHLPFLLDKHRLIQEAASLPIELLVVSRQLNEDGIACLAERLFTESRYSLRGNVVEMEPYGAGSAWVLDLTVSDPSKALPGVAQALAGGGDDLVLYCPEISEWDAEQVLESVSRRHCRIISDLDECLTDGKIHGRVLVHHCFPENDSLLALRAALATENPVIVRFHPKDEILPSQVSHAFPVLSDRNSRSLFIQHLRSVLRFLPARAPVHARNWRNFGWDFEDSPIRSANRGGTHGEISFEVDQIEPESDTQKSGLFPVVVLRNEQVPVYPVDVSRIGECFQWVFCDRNRTRYFVGEWSNSPDLDSPDPLIETAQWIDRTGSPLPSGTLDLPYLERLIYRDSRGTLFRCDQIEISNHRADLTVRQGNWSSRANLYTRPVFELSWEVTVSLNLSFKQGEVRQGYFWFDSENDADSPTYVHGQVNRLLNDVGLEQKFSPPLCYSFSGALSFFVIRPRNLAPEKLNLVSSRILEGEWSTSGKDKRFLPGLTGALNYALDELIPGVSFFGKCIVFRLEGYAGLLGELGVWIVGPDSSGKTAANAIYRFLTESPQHRFRLFEKALWAIEQLRSVPSPVETLRRLVGFGFLGDTKLSLDLDDCERILNDVLYWAREEMENRLADSDTRMPEFQVDDEFLLEPPRFDSDSDEWDVAAGVTSWEDCLARLWKSADDYSRLSWKMPLDKVNFHEGTRRLEFLLSFSGPGSCAEFGLSSTQMSGMVLSLEGASCTISPESFVSPEEFRQAILLWMQEYLPSSSIPKLTTMKLVLCEADVEGRGQESHDCSRLYTVLIGGFTGDGLALLRVPPSGGEAGQEDLVQEADPWMYPLDSRLPEDAPVPPSIPGMKDEWLAAPILPNPASMKITVDGKEFLWTHAGVEHQAGVKLSHKLDGYLAFLAKLPGRISERSYLNYIPNDPYANVIRALGDALRSKLPPGTGCRERAEFLLSFVQSFEYQHDPVKGTDWPKFPSEWLFDRGGDCEDSSIAYIALLLHERIPSVPLLMPDHMAVGLRGLYSGSYFNSEGHRYYYAETATNGSRMPVGEVPPGYGSAEILPSPWTKFPDAREVCILSAGLEHHRDQHVIEAYLVSFLSPAVELSVCLSVRTCGNVTGEIANGEVHSRKSLAKSEYEGQIAKIFLPVDTRKLPRGKIVFDLLVYRGAAMVGSWVGASVISVGS